MNVKARTRLIVLLVVIALIAGGAYGFYRFRQRQIALQYAALKVDGMNAARAGDYETAISKLREYLVRFKDDPEALNVYVDVRPRVESEGNAHIREAMNAMRHLQTLQPENLDVRLSLMRMYLRFDQRTETLDAAETLLARLAARETTAPLDAAQLAMRYEALRTQVTALIRQRRYEDALKTCDRLLEAQPADIEAHLTRLNLRRELRHPQAQVLKDIEELRKSNPDDPRFELVEGVAHALHGDMGSAVTWIRQAAARPAPDEAFTRVLVRELDQLRQNDVSLQILEDLTKRGASADVRLAFARRLFEMNRFAEAVEHMQDVTVADAGDPTMAGLKALCLIAAARPDEARVIINGLAARTDAAAQAWTTILRGTLDPSQGSDQDLVVQGRQALQRPGANAYLRYFVGEALARTGEGDLAVDAWQRAASESLTWALPLARSASVLADRGRLERAFLASREAVRRSPTDVTAIVTLARVVAMNEESGRTNLSNELLDLVTEVQTRLPGEPQTLVIRASLLADLGRMDEAKQVISDALKAQPILPEQALTRLAQVSKRHSLGLDGPLYELCTRTYGITPSLAFSQALQGALGDNPAEALADFDAARAASGKPEELAWMLSRARLLEVMQSADAPAAWIALGDAHPDDLPAQQAIASARSLQGQEAFLRRTVERLKKLGGEQSLSWRMLEARVNIDTAKDVRAYEDIALTLTDLVRRHPDIPEPRVLLARCFEAMGKTDEAIAELQTASNIYPQSTGISLYLAKLLQTRGDTERARVELEKVALSSAKPEQRRAAAMMLAEAGSADQAIQVLEELKTGGDEEVSDLILATLYRQQGRLAEAEQLLARLLSEQPTPQIIIYAADLYATTGDYPTAEKTLALLEGKQLDPGVADVAWGNYFARAGRPEDALKRYRQAVASAPKNSVAWNILITFHFLLGRTGEGLGLVEEASRNLPDDPALAAIRREADLIRVAADEVPMRPIVLAFVQNPLGNAQAVEALRAIFEARASGDPARILTSLQTVSEKYPAFLPVQLYVAQAYFELGRERESLQHVTRVAAMFPTLPQPVRIGAIVAARQGEWKMSRDFALQWRAMTRSLDDRRSADLAVAEASVELGEPQVALESLAPHLDNAKADPEANAPLLVVHAAALAEAGKPEEASDALWGYASQGPAWRIRYAMLAAGRLDEPVAIAWLDRVEKAIPADHPEEKAALGEQWAALAKRLNSKTAADRANQLFRSLAAAGAGNAGVLAAAAIHYEQLGDYGTAEGLYRRALAAGGAGDAIPVVQNNLAMVLSRNAGDLNEAITLATQAVEARPTIADFHDTLAYVQNKAGNHDLAVQNIRSAATLEPDNAVWHIRLARYLLAAGKRDESIQSLRRADSILAAQREVPDEIAKELQSVRLDIQGAGGN